MCREFAAHLFDVVLRRGLVRMLLVKLFFGFVASGLFFISTVAAGPEPMESEVLVIGPEVVITVGDLDLELQSYQRANQRRIVNDEASLRELVDAMYRRGRVVAWAREKGIDQDEAVQYRMRRAAEQVLMDVAQRRYLESIAYPDFSALARERYNASRDVYRVPEEVRVAHILVQFGEDTERADGLILVESLRERIEAGEAFSDLAERYSEDPGSASAGGDVGFFGKGRMVAEFEDAAFALEEVGDVSGVVETQFGYHLLKLLDRRPTHYRPFEDVQDSIMAGLRQDFTRTEVRQWLRDVANPDEALFEAEIWNDAESFVRDRVEHR